MSVSAIGLIGSASIAARAGSLAYAIAREAHWLKLGVSFPRLIIKFHLVV